MPSQLAYLRFRQRGPAATGEAQAGAQRPRSGAVPARAPAVGAGAIILAAVVLGVALRLYRLTRPGYLSGVSQYDDGVYFGDAVRLVHGALPYRDFVSDQPPGIMLLMAPVALLAKVTGTAWGMAIARLLTVCAEAATITLAGLLVRHRGTVAVTAACGIIAVYPASVVAGYTLFLEPWLNLFCLLGAVAAFDGDRLAGNRRLLLAGCAFGFAGAIKIWAIAPALVLLACCLRRRRGAAAFAAGTGAGFLIPVLPFAVAASPGSFVNSVIVTQLSRVRVTRYPLWRRLASMTGLTDVPHIGPTTALLVTAVLTLLIGAACVTAWVITRRPPAPLDWFALACAALVTLMMLWPRQYFHHYAAFLGPFLALAIALPAARAAAAGWAQWLGVGVAAAAVCVMAGIQVRAEAALAPAYSPAAAVQRAIPRGACVLTDMASLTISADRFVSDVPGCPLIVDSTGTDYVLSGGRNGNTGAAKVAAVPRMWQTAFAHAQYIWLSSRNRKFIAWTPALETYFQAHFSLVGVPGAPQRLYVRNGLTPLR